MRKLKKQIFLVVFLILTLFTTAVFVSFNVATYRQSYNSVRRSLSQTEKFRRDDNVPFGDNGDRGDFRPDFDEMDDIRFMDSVVYTVILDEDDNIVAVVNHSDNSISDDEIEGIAVRMISQSYQTNIGNLYFADYSYSYLAGSSIVIVDNSSTKEALRITLIYSLALYILLETIIFLAARILMLRITKPVADSFDKQKQFIADASHELKTPLSVIIASADALESNPNEKKWLDNIKSESDRMNKLVADLLELAKSEEITDKTEFAEGNLSKLVEKSVLTFEGVMFEKGVILKDNIEENITFYMNEFKISQLVSILLDNAIKHSEKGSEIYVELKKDKDITLSVRNKGEGIPKGEEVKIFERFYRADESRNRNENRYGLGLAIAKNIVLNHGGTISASSDNGYTTFKVTFK